ncbi:DUF6602 domain-containing protein [Streptomyces flavofungini]|uniref:DUF6602 domain-containing protein n=1 Tax=Streptomyces flavofungini TaxID=68200 RepID=UPI0025AEF315|nr:DUF6602 domain-containing protein [Streptomyces flavofungini]WJV44548.1 hypothetical protein QUY26_02775 [Streptomyces flavofungini]
MDYGPPGPNALRSSLAARAKELKAKAEAAAVFDHNGMKGEARETLLREVLTPLIPRHVEILQNAVIVNAQGAQSRQCDLLLKDHSWAPLFSTGRTSLVHAELTYGVIEVKSMLTSEELRQACDNIRAAKQVQKTSFTSTRRDPLVFYRTAYGREYPYFPTVGLIFAYDSNVKLETLGKTLWEWCQDVPLDQRPDAVFVPSLGCLLWVNDGGPLWTYEPGADLAAFPPDGEDDIFPVFAIALHQHFNGAWVPKWRLGDYTAQQRIAAPLVWRSNRDTYP